MRCAPSLIESGYLIEFARQQKLHSSNPIMYKNLCVLGLIMIDMQSLAHKLYYCPVSKSLIIRMHIMEKNSGNGNGEFSMLI